MPFLADKMKKLISILTLFVLMVPVIWGQDCTADDGTEGVELWGECYNIEETTELDLSYSGLTGEIPSEIGNLTNLTSLNFHYNLLTGEIPESICDLNIDWSGCYYFYLITNNQLCPPYPSCIEDYVGDQDTTDCP